MKSKNGETWNPEEQLLTKPTQIENQTKNENLEEERSHPLYSDIPEWLQEFRENLVDDEVPERRDSHANSSHEPSLERTPASSVDLGKHNFYTHFPKDRNCEICQRTKIRRAPCKRSIDGATPRAQKFGDLIAADHKLLNESCESRNNHRYAIVVQKTWPPNGSSRTHAEQKLHKKPKEPYGIPGARQESQNHLH